MKRNLISIVACFSLILGANAQVRVASDGNVYIQSSIYDDHAKLRLGSLPYELEGDNYFYKMGIHSSMYNTTAGKESVAIYGEATQDGSIKSGHGATIGVWGYGIEGPAARFGTVGGICVGPGAGIYGTVNGGPFSPFTGEYAGYFDGDTYVDGNFTACSIYNLSDMRLKNNVSLLSEDNEERGSALENLLGLNIIKYDLRSPYSETRTKALESMEDRKMAAAIKERDANRAAVERKHYGVSAQELQTVYPDLVMKGQDGYLAVNYTELVPILIRSIQELKAELDEVKGQGANKTRMAPGDDDAVDTQRRSMLYQNTPNPFKEQTVIRFRLADGVQNAAVCIFDMSGKMLRKMPVAQGMESITVSGSDLGEGIFLYSLVVNGQEIDTKRMILTK